MARLETWYKQDLKKPLIVHKHADVFNHDSQGNLIGVEVYSDGEPITLTGSISGYCLLADGTTVPAVGASRSGNKASILIPQTAYNVPGVITVTIKNVDGNDITTLCAVVGLVRQSVSGNLVNPGSVVTDWSNSINAQLQAVQDAADNVGAIVAAPFAENTVYVAGNYVTNNGNLYRITGDHAVGVTWANTQKVQATVGSELYDLKAALGNTQSYIDSNLDNLYGNFLSGKGESKTQNGVTFTVNDDGTVTVNGTASANTNLYFILHKPLPAQKMHLSGCPSGGSTSTYEIRIGRSNAARDDFTSVARDVGNGADYTPSSADVYCVMICIHSGYAASNLVFSPSLVIVGNKSNFSLAEETAELSETTAKNKRDIKGVTESTEFVSGARNTTDGSIGANTARCTSAEKYYLEKGDKIIVSGVQTGIKMVIATTTRYDSGWKTTDYSYVATDTCYCFVNVAKTSGNSISPTDFAMSIKVIYYSALPQNNKESVDALQHYFESNIDNYSGNLLYEAFGDQSGKVSNGITFTRDGDTVVVNGTATGNAYFYLLFHRPLYAKEIKLTGCPDGGSSTTYRLTLAKSNADKTNWTSVAHDDGEGVTYTVEDDATYCVLVNIRTGYTANNLVFAPVLSVNGAISNVELGKMVSANTHEKLTLATWNVGGYSYGNVDYMYSDLPVGSKLEMTKYISSLNADILLTTEDRYWWDIPNKELIYDAIYSPMYKHWYGSGYGSPGYDIQTNGKNIYAQYPLSNTGRYKFSTQGASYAACTYCTVTIAGKDVLLMAIHLDASTDTNEYRIAQIAELLALDIVQQHDYVVIAGDFNTIDSVPLAAFTNAGYVLANMGRFGDYVTYNKNSAGRKLDNIVVTPNIKMQNIKSVQTDFENTDHYALTCTLYF